MRKDQHVDAIDSALDAMAADPDVTDEEYVEALDDITFRVQAAADQRRPS